jgi:hypothetical protein
MDGSGLIGSFLTHHFILFGIEFQNWMVVAVVLVVLFVLYERWERSR